MFKSKNKKEEKRERETDKQRKEMKLSCGNLYELD